MSLLWGKTVYHLSCGNQPLFPTTDKKFQVKRRMKGGCVLSEDLYLIIIFVESIVKNTLKLGRQSPGKPWKIISFHCWPPCFN